MPKKEEAPSKSEKAGRKPEKIPWDIRTRIVEMRSRRYTLSEISNDTGISKWKLRRFLYSIAVK